MTAQTDGLLTLRWDGVLGAAGGGALRAVTTGALQRVSAGMLSVQLQTTRQSHSQVVLNLQILVLHPHNISNI